MSASEDYPLIRQGFGEAVLPIERYRAAMTELDLLRRDVSNLLTQIAQQDPTRLRDALIVAEEALRSQPMQAFKNHRDQTRRARAIDAARDALGIKPT